MKHVIVHAWIPMVFLSTLAGCGPDRLVILDDSLEPVRSEFNAQRGRPRVVALFSPT